MASPAASNEAPSRRGRWLRRLGYAVGAFAALVLGAWVAVPPIVKGQVESRLSALLDRPTTVGSVAFDPLRLRLTLGKLAIARRTGTDSLFTVDELSADVSLASLWHRAPVLDALSIVRPYLWLARDGEGQYNVQDLVDALLARYIEVPRASINNIEIVDGTVVFVDVALERTHEVKALDVAIPFLSSLPYEASIRVTPRVQGSFNGTHFALTGTSTPFAERREVTLDVDVDALPLPSYVGYLPVRPRFAVAGGALTTKLQLVFVGAAGRERRLELRGEARVDGLAVHRLDGTALVSAQRLAVALDRVDLLGRDARIAAVTIDAPALDVKRLADGTLEWQHLLPGAGPTAAAAPTTPAAAPGPAWGVRVGKLVVDRGTIALADAGSTFRSTLVDVAVDAAGLASRPGEKGRVKVGFQSSDRIAAFSAEAEVEPGVPAASGRFALKGFSLGLLFPFYQSALAVDVQKGSLEYASAFTLDGDGRLRLDGGEAAIADLRLALPGNPQPMWRVPQLSLRGIDVDVSRRSVTVAEAQSRGANLRVRRESDGTLEMARIVKAANDAPASDEVSWTLLTKKLALEGVALDLEDRVPEPPARLALRDLALTATDVGSAATVRSGVTLSARIGKQGRVAFAGPFARQPFGGDGQLELSGFPLVALKPYVEPRVNVVLTDGSLSGRGRLAVGTSAAGALRASWKGDVAIADFAALDRPTASDLARWKRLALDGCDVATEPFRASVARIALDDFFARVIVYPDATLNMMRLLTPGASPEPAAEAAPKPASASLAPREALPVSIGRIELNRGNVNFSDLYVKPNYSANLTEVTGSVTALSAEQAGKVTVSAAHRPLGAGGGRRHRASVRAGALARPRREAREHRPAGAHPLRRQVRGLWHREGAALVRRALPGREPQARRGEPARARPAAVRCPGREPRRDQASGPARRRAAQGLARGHRHPAADLRVARRPAVLARRDHRAYHRQPDHEGGDRAVRAARRPRSAVARSCRRCRSPRAAPSLAPTRSSASTRWARRSSTGRRSSSTSRAGWTRSPTARRCAAPPCWPRCAARR